jgi:predicted cupin superfamily sugar epimerase
MTSTESIKDRLVRQFALQPHPEGGFYRETYRCAEHVLRPAPNIARSASTAIYYLLCDDAYSAWHRIRSDEVWHFYAGGPLDVHVLHDDGTVITHRLGNALERDDAVFQAVVPAGCWFAAERVDSTDYALVGCTVAPGFEFSDFEIAATATLLATYPRHHELIQRLAAK